MNDYRTFTVEELALDPFFRAWLLTKDPQATQFWERWLVENRDCTAQINQAKELLTAIRHRFPDDLSESVMHQDLNRLKNRVVQTAPETPVLPLWRTRWWKIAAAVALLVGGSWWSIRQTDTDPAASTDQPVMTPTNGQLSEKFNRTDHPQTVLLSDGSIITLESNSRLTFPPSFKGTERIVYLTGEAFFEVARNPAQPFLVYTRESVTKVLGTSFRVKAAEKDPTVQVAVRTGRVSVYTKAVFAQLQRRETTQAEGVVLLPNQQVTLNRKDGRLVKGLVENPAVIAASIKPQEVSFDDKPVSFVLRNLEQLYAIDILFDETALKNCHITTTFADESLRERLSDICQAIGASYEIIDGQVVINAKGCSP